MIVVLSLGSNLGDRRGNMAFMERELRQVLSGEIRVSPLYETAPIGVGDNHQPYLNRIVSGQFDGTPEELLAITEQIEIRIGRTEKGKLAPRTGDIDLLVFGTMIVESESLTIPHHALFDRRFEIEGVQAVVPEMTIPGHTIRFREYELREDVKNQELTIV